MKKMCMLFIALLVLSGCSKEKQENLSNFDNYDLKIKSSDICEFKDLLNNENAIVKSYCIDSILVTDKDNKTYELTNLLKDGVINMNNVVDGLVIKSEEKDGSVVLYKEQNPEYNIIKCADNYPNDYVIVNFMDYQKFFCEL